MSAPASLLIELGTEELPPQSLDTLSAALLRGLLQGLEAQGIAADAAGARSYASPRRLAAWIPAVAPRQPDQSQERRGPALAAALDEAGEPTPALQGFARSCGVAVDELEQMQTDKGAWFVHRSVRQGQPLAALLQGLLDAALKTLPIPRPMRWGAHEHSFVRPVHWLVALHGAQVVDLELFDLSSGSQSRGHRFHHPGPVAISHADAWLDELRAAHVLADPEQRRERVREQVASAAQQVGGEPQLDDELLATIANLTEWPVAVPCSFDRSFLDLPQEALMTVMRVHQKFIPLTDAQGQLNGHFIGVANIDSSDPEQIRAGYQRVIAPRFADARFFYDEDRTQPLSALQSGLRDVTYQEQLGTLWDKSMRVAELARMLAAHTGADGALVARAAALSRCDLLTRMVGEFPELQGVMGHRYARQGDQAEPAEVALAIEEFYRPVYSRDRIAANTLAQTLAVADRLDTLSGIFAVGLRPSGSRDPFALRRAALGLARTVIEGGLQIDLPAALLESLYLLPEVALAGDGGGEGADIGARRTMLADELYRFILDRLRGYYTDQGIDSAAFEAVRVLAPRSLLDLDQRVHAVKSFMSLPASQPLAEANKRIANILRRADTPVGARVDATLLEAGAEHALADALARVRDDIAAADAGHDYAATLQHLARLNEPIAGYFDEVMVMADDVKLRNNRLALLGQLRALFLSVADISVL